MPPLYKHTYGLVNKHASLTAYNPAYNLRRMKFGERLRKAREYAGLSQAQLAEHIGISQPAISQLEKGDGTGSEFTVQFAVRCGVRPEWLATGELPMVNAFPTDRRIAHVIAVMEQMDDYVRDEAVKEVDHLAELATRLRNGTRGQ